jgi:hypothetical protein
MQCESGDAVQRHKFPAALESRMIPPRPAYLPEFSDLAI